MDITPPPPPRTFFLLQHDGGYILLDRHPRTFTQFRQSELLTTFRSYASALAFLQKKGLEAQEIFEKKHRRPHTKEAKEKMRQQKLGAKNPNAKGLSELHKQRIGRANKGKYIGSENINYGKPRTLRDRMKISRGKYLEAQRVKRRWVLSPLGEEFLFPVTQPLPEGWTIGRKRSSAVNKRPRRRRPKKQLQDVSRTVFLMPQDFF